MRRLIFKEIPAQPSSGESISVMEVSGSTADGTCFARQNRWI
jgi:hypothetical protein